MYCLNYQQVCDWFDQIRKKNTQIRRYKKVSLSQISDEDFFDVLRRHVAEWLNTGDHVTFWHLKQLIQTLKNQETRIPVVLTRYHGRPFVDPGYSRLCALALNGKQTVDADVVYPDKHTKEIGLDADFELVVDTETLLAPYESIGITYRLDTCFQSPCITCERNSVVHNGDFRYSAEWSSKWFYPSDYHAWYENSKKETVEDVLDWYFV